MFSPKTLIITHEIRFSCSNFVKLYRITVSHDIIVFIVDRCAYFHKSSGFEYASNFVYNCLATDLLCFILLSKEYTFWSDHLYFICYFVTWAWLVSYQLFSPMLQQCRCNSAETILTSILIFGFVGPESCGGRWNDALLTSQLGYWKAADVMFFRI